MQDTTALNLAAYTRSPNWARSIRRAGPRRSPAHHLGGDRLGAGRGGLGAAVLGAPPPGQPGPPEKESGKWIDGIDAGSGRLVRGAGDRPCPG